MKNLRRWGLILVVALTASSCGDGGSRTETTAIESLAEALSGAAAATSYRIETSIGNRVSSTAFDMDAETELDPDHPATVTEVTPDATHAVMDLSSALGPMNAPLGGTLVLEMWATAEGAVFDTTSYQLIVDADPQAPLGPFRPGVFEIRADAVAELVDDDNDLLSALGGETIDLANLAATLPAVLRDVEPDPDRPGTYVGTVSIADMDRALGVDGEEVARQMSAAMTLLVDVDADALVAVYLDFFEQTDIELEVTVERGLLSTLEYEYDIGGIHDYLFDPERAGVIFGATPAEANEAARFFADTVWVQSSFTRFLPDPDLVVEDSPATSDDRSEEFVDFMLSSGAFD